MLKLNQVYLPDLGHTCRSEDKNRFSLSKYAAVRELWLPRLVPLQPTLTKHHRLGYEHTFSVPEFLPSSNMVIMAFRRQIEYKVIFILILHQNTIQGNSGLPSPPPPTHGSNRYPDIHNFQSPPWVFLVKSRNIQVGFGIGMVEDPVTDPKCPLIFVFWIPLSS